LYREQTTDGVGHEEVAFDDASLVSGNTMSSESKRSLEMIM